MKVGDRVKVNHLTNIYYHFFDAVGTIIAEYQTRNDVQKFIVLFDNPVIVPDTPDPFYGAGDLFLETFAFVCTGLDLLEEVPSAQL